MIRLIFFIMLAIFLTNIQAQDEYEIPSNLRLKKSLKKDEYKVPSNIQLNKNVRFLKSKIDSRNDIGIKAKNNVEIISWRSVCNVFTVGNNDVDIKIRNKNHYDVTVSISLKYASGWKIYRTIDIPAGRIINHSGLGTAWKSASDISITAVY